MPRYFFDTKNGSFHHSDESGQDMADDTAARLAALEVLPGMARDHIPGDDSQSFVVVVRDASGKAVYSAELTLNGRWGLPEA